MCGIAGFLDFNRKTDLRTLKKMTDALIHRGPDDAGYEIFENTEASVGFGQRRLSILDLSPLGHQPMHFGDLVVNFNGEIYNFKEIRKELESKGYHFNSWSDTEVILKGYDCWGLDVLKKFIGMFAIALYDKKKEKLYLIRDRAGIKPLYYFDDLEIILFGSELKALYEHPLFKKNIDVSSLALYLQYSYIPAPHTIFHHVYKLLPGHILSIDIKTKEQEQTKYWDVYDYYQKPKLQISEQDAIIETENLLKNAYEYRMVADVPVGVFLSGGYDSSSVAALLQTGRTERLKTFTIGFHEADFNEAKEAAAIAKFLGTDHTEWYLTANEASQVLSSLPEIYDEPFADNSTVPTTLVSQLARKQVKVALSADGGDEIFGGYNKFQQAEKYTTQMPVPVQSALSGMMSLINPSVIPYFNKQYNFTTRYEKMKLIWKDHDPVNAIKYISQYITESEVRTLLRNSFTVHKTFFDEVPPGFKNDGQVNRMLSMDYKTFLVDNNLVKVDRATMSVGLEGREPMLDHRLIEWLAILPSDFKIRDGVKKYLLKEIVHKYIPKEMMDRPKKPFIAPLTLWFKDDLREQLRYYLSEEKIKSSGFFNPAPVKVMVDDYLSGKLVNYQKIWQLLVFQLWYNRWISPL